MSNSSPDAGGPPVCYRHPGREAHIRCQRCGRSICPDCMRDAAVGFQCPSCIAEGVKSTRSGRTTYGGAVPRSLSSLTIGLIGSNVFVWVLILVTGWRESQVILRLALLPTGQCGSLAVPDQVYPRLATEAACVGPRTGGDGRWFPGVADGSYWQLLTNAFVHIDVTHILFNMVALWLLGPQLVRVLGNARFLALYLVSALAASTVVYWVASPTSTTLGASGAVFGMLGALLVIAYKSQDRANLQQLLILLAINAVLTFTISDISWEGHLGGLLGGAAAGALLVYAPRPRRTTVQVLGMSGLVALLLLAIIARSAALA